MSERVGRRSRRRFVPSPRDLLPSRRSPLLPTTTDITPKILSIPKLRPDFARSLAGARTPSGGDIEILLRKFSALLLQGKLLLKPGGLTARCPLEETFALQQSGCDGVFSHDPAVLPSANLPLHQDICFVDSLASIGPVPARSWFTDASSSRSLH